MQMVALTFRAESDFIDALKAYADNAGMSVNSVVKEILSPVIGVFRQKHREQPSFMKFAGCLSRKEADEMLEFNRKASFSKVDEEMWK